MAYKALQAFNSGGKEYGVGEIVPNVENSPNLPYLISCKYLIYTEPEKKTQLRKLITKIEVKTVSEVKKPKPVEKPIKAKG